VGTRRCDGQSEFDDAGAAKRAKGCVVCCGHAALLDGGGTFERAIVAVARFNYCCIPENRIPVNR
jgi:hypothetical protein